MATQKSINSPSIRDRVKVFLFEQTSGGVPSSIPQKLDKELIVLFIDSSVEPIPGDKLYLGENAILRPYKGGNVPVGTIGVFAAAAAWKIIREPFCPSDEVLFDLLPTLPLDDGYQRNHGSLFECQRPTVSAVG